MEVVAVSNEVSVLKDVVLDSSSLDVTTTRMSLDGLAESINAEYAQALEHQEKAGEHAVAAMSHALAVGRMLEDVKAELKRHGKGRQYEKWVRENTSVPLSTARLWRRLAKNDNSVSEMGIREAIRYLAQSTPETSVPHQSKPEQVTTRRPRAKQKRAD